MIIVEAVEMFEEVEDGNMTRKIYYEDFFSAECEAKVIKKEENKIS